MPAGRPLKFQSVEELQAKIDEYFKQTPADEYTWTGLALFLDTSRETLREYQERPEYVDPLKRALLRVENGYEIDLKKHGRAGSIFALKNFDWHDRQEREFSGGILITASKWNDDNQNPAQLPPPAASIGLPAGDAEIQDRSVEPAQWEEQNRPE